MADRPDQGQIDDVIVHTRLENGLPVCIRAVRPNDEARLRSGIDQLSQQSRYMRFFSVAPAPPDRVIEKLVQVDGHHHLAWGAILTDDPAHTAIGVVHAIRTDPATQRAEFAIGVLDTWHGLGLARMLTAVLLVHCRIEGIAALDAQILSENKAATSFVHSLGAVRQGTDTGVAAFTLEVAGALAVLRRSADPAGLSAVFAAFSAYL